MVRRFVHTLRGLPDAARLDRLYHKYNAPAWRASDPVEFVHRYRDPLDREVAGIVASSLAFGTVAQIRESARLALAPLGESPAAFLADAPPESLRALYGGFRHRWITGGDVAALLGGVRNAVATHGSLGGLFAAATGGRDGDVVRASCRFVDEIRLRGGPFRSCLLPSPADGSACKRLFLFLRWMVRRDEIDAGLWRHVRPAALIVPLDTHMHRVARELGLTRRRAADLRAAREVTDGFRAISPEDPVKYDFALTREAMLPAGRKERRHG